MPPLRVRRHGIAAVVANYLLPEAFSYLVASGGAIALMMYMVIALTQYATRRRGGRPAGVRMWAFPYLTLATVAFIVGVLVLMAVLPGHRLELWLSLGLAAVLVVSGAERQRRRGAMGPGPAARLLDTERTPERAA